MSRRAALAASLLLASVAAAAQDEDPAAVLAQLEQRLLAARHVVVEASIQSRGLIASNLKGRSELFDRNRATWVYAGDFAGKPADLSLSANGRTLQLMNGPQTRLMKVDAESNRALLVGLVRMGLLHNLARLTELQEPDHARGGVEQWVKLDSFRPTTFAQGGELAGMMSFGFDLVVAGATSGSVQLWVDPESNLPRRRTLTVRFPQGEMKVVEDYERFVAE